MRASRRHIAALALAVVAPLAASTTACVVDDSDPAPAAVIVPTLPAEGTLVVDWTISGVRDPAQCRQGAVAVIVITVYFDNGALAGTFEQACEAFATSIPLAAGRYFANAVLVDAARQPRTTAAPIDPFFINGNDQLSIPIDFPAVSFF